MALDKLTIIDGGGLSTTSDYRVGIITATKFIGPIESQSATFTGNVSIGGTLTYEDVTNIDSVGIITARSNILVGSGITLSPDGHVFTTGISTISSIVADKISLPDSSVGSINVGLGSDLQIFHTGSNSAIQNSTGQLSLISDDAINLQSKTGSEYYFRAYPNNRAELYFDFSTHNTPKLQTSATGVTVDGTVAATSYTGDGSSLTGISVGIATTAASMTGITTVLDLSKDDIKITAAGITTVDVRGGTEGNSHTLRIVNSGITTVGFSTYFLFPSGGTPNLPTTDGAISLISFSVHRQGAVGLATQLLAGASVNFS